MPFLPLPKRCKTPPKALEKPHLPPNLSPSPHFFPPCAPISPTCSHPSRQISPFFINFRPFRPTFPRFIPFQARLRAANGLFCAFIPFDKTRAKAHLSKRFLLEQGFSAKILVFSRKTPLASEARRKLQALLRLRTSSDPLYSPQNSPENRLQTFQNGEKRGRK